MFDNDEILRDRTILDAVRLFCMVLSLFGLGYGLGLYKKASQ